jgi:hypothetical protein
MILVDSIQATFPAVHGHVKWCHMMTDDLSEDGLQELHDFAGKLGLKRSWFQNHNKAFPHYDLTPSKRRLAVQLGAEEVAGVDMVKRCKRG